MLNKLRRRSWKVLYRMSGVEYWLRRRFTGAGQMVLVAALVGALFGIDTRKTLGSQIFGLGISLIFIAVVSSLYRLKGLTAIRYLPRYATVGVPVRYSVQIKNSTSHSINNLTIQERPPDPRPSLTAFLHTAAPWEERVNFLDRFIGYPRWRWLVHQGRRIDNVKLIHLPMLTTGAEAIVELEFTPVRRGPLLLKNLEVKRTDPMGLCWRYMVLNCQDRLIVLPQRYSIPPQRPLGRRRLQPGGVALAATVGDSQEFIGLREYRVGDSTRHIHWAAWARSGTPVVKEYQDEYFSRQSLILDSFISNGQEEAFEVAVSVAASFVEPLTGGDALLDLMFVADKAYTLTGGRGVLSAHALLEALACVEPQSTAFTQLSSAVLAHAPLLSSCICIFLAWDAPRQELVHNLRVLGTPLKIFIVGESSSLEYGPMVDQPQNLRWLDVHNVTKNLLYPTPNPSP